MSTLYLNRASYKSLDMPDGKTNFFSAFLNYMQPNMIKQYAKKYYVADDVTRFAVMIPYMAEKEQQDWLKKAQADKKNSFFTVLSDNLFWQTIVVWIATLKGQPPKSVAAKSSYAMPLLEAKEKSNKQQSIIFLQFLNKVSPPPNF